MEGSEHLAELAAAYVLGALDTVGVLYALEYAGLGEYANPRQLVELVTTWITG